MLILFSVTHWEYLYETILVAYSLSGFTILLTVVLLLGQMARTASFLIKAGKQDGSQHDPERGNQGTRAINTVSSRVDRLPNSYI